MKKKIGLIFIGCFGMASAQMNEDSLPSLIPRKIDQKSGYINQSGKIVIAPEYHIAMFFSEDCNLLNSPNENAKIFGSAEYATVEKNSIAYRINKKGKRVYEYKDDDLGRCSQPYEMRRYKAFRLNGMYGLVSKDSDSIDVEDYKDFDIYPQYEMLYVLESDKENPMMIAVKDNKFGVVDKQNKIIVPFAYNDIKANLSWKTAHLFEVSEDGEDYFYVDKNNNAY